MEKLKKISGKDSILLRVFDYEISPIKFVFLYIAGLIILYVGYISYQLIFNWSEKWSHTYSTGAQFLLIICWPFALVGIVIGAIVFVVMAYYTLFYLYIFLKELPNIIRNEIDIVKRIWANRGFGKYAIFGGLSFYLKLRQRVFAYFFAFISIGIITWFFAFKQHSYEKTYWKINFYYNEPLPSFTFKGNIPYTIKASEDLYGILINGRRYITGKNTSYTGDAPFMIPLTLPKNWNITFPDTTIVEFMFYEDYISQIFSMTLEVWENKREGMMISPSQFSYITSKETNNNKSKNNKTKKRKN